MNKPSAVRRRLLGTGAALLPDMENLREISTAVAAAVYYAAVEDGVATKKP